MNTQEGRVLLFTLLACFSISLACADDAAKVLTGKAAMGDWTTDAPGVRRTFDGRRSARTERNAESAKNQPKLVKRPEGAWPKAPDGFKVAGVCAAT